MAGNDKEWATAADAPRLTQFSLDRADECVFRFNRDGRLIYVNDTACRMLGYSREALLAMGVGDIDPDVRPGDFARSWERIKANGHDRFEARLLTSDGAIFPVEVSSYYFEHENCELLDSFARDITERRRAEAMLHGAKQTAELANTAKSQFLAAASHDLRQPMQALSLLLAALPNAASEPERHEIGREMQEAMRSMESVLDALLDISQLDAGAVISKPTDFSLADLLASLGSRFGRQAEAKGLDFRTIACGCTVLSDRALLERIVENFLANAIRYTPAGKILLGCRRRGHFLRIEVWDSGPGIPKDQLTAIFDEFHRLDNPARDRSKGLGLGLAIVDRIARLLQHPIDVRSSLGRGSMFAVEVPMSTHAPVSTARSPGPQDAAGSLADLAIVAIDDEPMVLSATRRLLEQWGAKVVAVPTIEGALEELAKTRIRPNLVVADFRLAGGTSGVGAGRRIAAELGTSVPIVIVSGDTTPGIRREIEAAGLLLISKPIDPAYLMQVIRERVGDAAE